MHIIESMAAAFALLVLLLNTMLYTWRAFVLRRMRACEREDQLGLLNAATAFLEECAALAAVILLIPVGWCLPRCTTGPGLRGPLLLVHGWGVNRGALWWLRRRLLRDGWSPVCCLDYHLLAAGVDGAATRLRVLVETVARDRPVILVGHSLGGLVARYYVRHHPTPAIRRLVTLGTPHRGTLLGHVPGLTRGCIAPESPLIQALSAADRVPQQLDVIAIQSHFDAMVLPPANAEYPGAFNVRVTAVGHNALLFSPKVYALLVENLAAP